ncbi:signal peptidase II [Cryptosporangium aurantiacum]|uniref:Lipoprotein signal peptidase n=1 Tax=Cryptosporangium aurantiacum TaxID=134849 RepID=A0A1M7I612_9ACTN|nr:signal peptidase II [Cryptosporangium aurantiacum]SHM36204.1 signal peptidase II [Cryptosporangium aurantiacum]
MRELQADRGAPLTRPADSDPRGAAPVDGQQPVDPDAPDPGTADHPADADPAATRADAAAPNGTGADPAIPAPADAAAPNGAGAGPATSTPADADATRAAADAAEGASPGPAAAEGSPGGVDSDPAAHERDGGLSEDAQETVAGPRTRRGRWLFALVALLTLAADVISKLVVVAKLEDTNRPPVEVLANVLYLVHTRNTGAAFSLGSGYTYVLTAIAVGVIVVIIRTARKLASTPWALALGLVLGGACGNVVDRLFREGGGVVDFLAVVDPFDPPWPVFNLADSALCVGVALIVVLELTGRRIDGSRATKAGRAQSKDD